MKPGRGAGGQVKPRKGGRRRAGETQEGGRGRAGETQEGGHRRAGETRAGGAGGQVKRGREAQEGR